jgi:hypothetical protein
MYQFVKTATGWRVFWGIDPLGKEVEPMRYIDSEPTPEEPAVLPFQRPGHEWANCPSA